MPSGPSSWRQEARAACRVSGPRIEGVDEVHTGTSLHLFHSEQIISGKEDEAMNFADGH
jgi:hypothetical protein